MYKLLTARCCDVKRNKKSPDNERIADGKTKNILVGSSEYIETYWE